MTRAQRWLWALMLACAASAQQPTDTNHYPPSSKEPNVIRIWGDAATSGLLQVWESAYGAQHPEISFKNELRGTATGMAGIITNSADIAMMGRPATVNEIIGFEWVYRAKPLGVQVANGGLRGEGASPALAVLVAKANPLTHISMAELSAVLGCPGNGALVPTWAVAGATGAWASRPVHAYLYDNQTGTGDFLQHAVLGKGDCWNWDAVTEFKDERRGGRLVTARAQIVAALRREPAGLAIASPEYASAGLKALAISDGGPALQATPASIVDATYPLRRSLYAYVTRLPGKPVDAKVADFLRFVLSQQGQDMARRQRTFLPLNAAVAGEQLRKVE